MATSHVSDSVAEQPAEAIERRPVARTYGKRIAAQPSLAGSDVIVPDTTPIVATIPQTLSERPVQTAETSSPLPPLTPSSIAAAIPTSSTLSSLPTTVPAPPSSDNDADTTFKPNYSWKAALAAADNDSDDEADPSTYLKLDQTALAKEDAFKVPELYDDFDTAQEESEPREELTLPSPKFVKVIYSDAQLEGGLGSRSADDSQTPAPSHKKGKRAAISDSEEEAPADDHPPVDPQPSSRTLTREEKLRDMVSKRQKAQTPAQNKQSLGNESKPKPDSPPKRKKKTKVKQQLSDEEPSEVKVKKPRKESKRAIDERHRESAALTRTQFVSVSAAADEVKQRRQYDVTELVKTDLISKVQHAVAPVPAKPLILHRHTQTTQKQAEQIMLSPIPIVSSSAPKSEIQNDCESQDVKYLESLPPESAKPNSVKISDDLPDVGDFFAAKVMERNLTLKKNMAIQQETAKDGPIVSDSDSDDLEIVSGPTGNAAPKVKQEQEMPPPTGRPRKSYHPPGINASMPSTSAAVVTDSQLDQSARTHKFGNSTTTVSKHVDSGYKVPSKANKKKDAPIGHDQLSKYLLGKSAYKNIEIRTQKALNAGERPQTQNEFNRASGGRDLASMSKQLADKEARVKQQELEQEQAEDEVDADFDPEKAEEADIYSGEEQGSGSEHEDEAASGSEDEETEDLPARTARPGKKSNAVIPDDEESDEELPAQEPMQVGEETASTRSDGPAGDALGFDLNLSGGFTQMFDSPGAGGPAASFGVNKLFGAPKLAAIETPVIARHLLATQALPEMNNLEDAQDFEEARQRVPESAPRQYLNADGFFTQTKPIARSPNDTPGGVHFTDESYAQESMTQLDTPLHRNTFNSLSTASATMKVASQSPANADEVDVFTAKPSRKLMRGRAHSSLLNVTEHPSQENEDGAADEDINEEPTQTSDQPIEETEVVEETEPPVAQKNAFDLMKEGAARPKEKPKKRKMQTNDFVEDQAGRSDDEDNPHARSMGDVDQEDENDEGDNILRSEDVDMVDDEVVDAEIQAEQDARAAELHRLAEEDADAQRQKQATKIAKGQMKNKKRSDEIFSDSDYDDEEEDALKHRKRKRPKKEVKNDNIENIRANPDGRAFAETYYHSKQTNHEDADTEFLRSPEASEDEEDFVVPETQLDPATRKRARSNSYTARSPSAPPPRGNASKRRRKDHQHEQSDVFDYKEAPFVLADLQDTDIPIAPTSESEPLAATVKIRDLTTESKFGPRSAPSYNALDFDETEYTEYKDPHQSWAIMEETNVNRGNNRGLAAGGGSAVTSFAKTAKSAATRKASGPSSAPKKKVEASGSKLAKIRSKSNAFGPNP